MDSANNPYASSTSPETSSVQAERGNDSILGKICFWMAAFVWIVPLLISWTLFLVSRGDAENLGFWVITRYGPFVSFVCDVPATQIRIYFLPPFLDIAFVITAWWIARYRRYGFSIPILIEMLIWYCWGIFEFLEQIHIA